MKGGQPQMDMYDKLNELYEKRRQMKLGGGKQRINQQHAKGKLTACERIAYLLEAESFVEFYPFIKQRVTSMQNEESAYVTK
ncbi:carboxyl transferase domain-containing protein [Virgibacillus chiguensis]|nr:carboxyl transferase domain-containing protein [Virgibacillus chiguensis]